MKNNIKTYILWGLMAYAFTSAIGITLAEIFLIACLILAAADIWLNKTPLSRVFTTPVSLAIAAFVCAHLLSACFGIAPLVSLKDFKKVYIILMFFVAAKYSGKEPDIKRIIDAFIAGAALVGIYAAAMTVYNRYMLGNPDFRASSFSGNHMHAGGMLMMACIVSAGAFLNSLKTRARALPAAALYLAAFLIISLGLLFTYTRGSWLAALFGITMLAACADRRLVAALALAAIAVVFVMRDTSFIKRAMSSFQMDPGFSAGERVLMWKSGLQIIKASPVIGIGTGSLEKIYPGFRQPEAREPNAGHLHNNLIQIAAIDGFLGLGAFLWIFISFWLSLGKAFLKEKKEYAKHVIFLALAVNVAFFINGLFEYNLFSTQVALMFWFLMGTGMAMIKSGIKRKNEL